MKKFRKVVIYKILPKLLVVLGLLVAIYPWISDYIYRDKMSEVISDYQNSVDEDKELMKSIEKAAREYNKDLNNSVVTLSDPFNVDVVKNSLHEKYRNSKIPTVEGDMVGYITIPKISVYLPIYFGTTNTVLQGGTGLLSGSSLPTKGKNIHSVITGHTGLSDKKMFTDLNKLEKGDLFFINAFGEKLCYKVFQIEVVLPSELGSLYVKKGKNLCTLVTCTPYGINSHRLLVTGKKIKYEEGMEDKQEKSNYVSDWKKEYFICVIVGLVLAVLLDILVKIRKGKKNAKKKENTV